MLRALSLFSEIATAIFHRGDKDVAPFYRKRHLHIHHLFIFGPRYAQHVLEDRLGTGTAEVVSIQHQVHQIRVV